MSYTGSVPHTAVRRLDWMEQMACRDVGPALFEENGQEHEARTICIAHCPVRSECLARVKLVERGLHRDQRGGVVAALTHVERHRLDAEAPRHQGDAAVLQFDGTERCGTHLALLRHLWLDEPIDSKCWSGKVKRDRKNRRAAAPGEPAPATGAAPTTGLQPRVNPQPHLFDCPFGRCEDHGFCPCAETEPDDESQLDDDIAAGRALVLRGQVRYVDTLPPIDTYTPPQDT